MVNKSEGNLGLLYLSQMKRHEMRERERGSTMAYRVERHSPYRWLPCFVKISPPSCKYEQLLHSLQECSSERLPAPRLKKARD